MVFSETTNRTGLVQLLEDLTGTQAATTSSYPLSVKTRDINNAYSNYFLIASSSEGRWQVDDTNHTDYPIITAHIAQGQQDYSFNLDASSNQILDIYRIEVTDENGNARELIPIDQFDIKGIALTEFLDQEGQPLYYDKIANAVFLYPKPSYSRNNALRIYFTRTPSFFLSTDTTKTPGIPHVFHEYLALRPAYQYCLRKSPSQWKSLKDDVDRIEKAIKAYYSQRSKDEVLRFIPRGSSSR